MKYLRITNNPSNFRFGIPNTTDFWNGQYIYTKRIPTSVMGKILKSINFNVYCLSSFLVFIFCTYMFLHQHKKNAEINVYMSPYLNTFPYVAWYSMHSSVFQLRRTFVGRNVLMDKNARCKVAISEISNKSKDIWGRY